jgi:DNA adenine methylase
MGGKRRIAKYIAPFLNRHKDAIAYYEPFVGAGSVATLVSIQPKFLSDNHPTLCQFYVSLQDYYRRGKPFPFLQRELTKEEYNEIKENPADPTWTFVGFNCSLLGKWWGGWLEPGPRRGQPYRAGLKTIDAFMKAVYEHTNFKVCDYKHTNPPAQSVIYCDPPYAKTTGYKKSRGFDHEEFWVWAEEMSKSSYVYVSEQTAPEGWIPVWSKDILNHSSTFSKNISDDKSEPDRRLAEHLFTKGLSLQAFPHE